MNREGDLFVGLVRKERKHTLRTPITSDWRVLGVTLWLKFGARLGDLPIGQLSPYLFAPRLGHLNGSVHKATSQDIHC
jgi:hypothetical protein